jgi:hypothetical protein
VLAVRQFDAAAGHRHLEVALHSPPHPPNLSLASTAMVRRGCDNPFAAGLSATLGEPEHLPDLDAERLRDALLRQEARAPSATLQVRDVRRLELRGVGEILLGPAPVLAKRSYRRSERSPQVVHLPSERREAGS